MIRRCRKRLGRDLNDRIMGRRVDMRRKEREVTDKAALIEILESCFVFRLGLCYKDRPYVVPLNFGYAWEQDQALELYFRCAREGLKLDMLAKNDLVCFEMDSGHKLITKEDYREYSFAYSSIIGWGRAAIITDTEEKSRALIKLLEHQAGPGNYNLSEADMAKTTVVRIRAEEITGKQNKYR